MSIIKKYPLLVAFVFILVVIFIADLLNPDREFSEMENKYLADVPHFSFSALFSNEYTKDYEEYINDQFVGRDTWISAKSISESALLKVENNDVMLGDDDYLFAKVTQPNETVLAQNIGYIASFSKRFLEEVTVAISPNSYAMEGEELPLGAEYIIINQLAQIADINATLAADEIKTLDVASILGEAEQEDIYYRTDHHWTTDGAWNVYSAYAQAQGIEYVELEDLQQYRNEESGFYGTYHSKAKTFGSPGDTLVWYDIPVSGVEINGATTIEDKYGEEIPIEGLYNKTEFLSRDKYAAFLYGNNGHTVITTDNNLNSGEDTEKILIIKDSYANCIAPFFTYSYDEVHLVDLRSLTEPISDLMERENFDDVLILYNYDSFENDRTVFKIAF